MTKRFSIDGSTGFIIAYFIVGFVVFYTSTPFFVRLIWADVGLAGAIWAGVISRW